MTAKLVLLAGPRCGDTFSIDAADTIVGRDAATHLNIPDHLMSRRHCAVAAVNGRFTIRDLGSSNGTYVNGIAIRERELAHGDRIRAGDSVLLFLQQTAPQDDADGLLAQATARICVPREKGDADPSIVAEVLAGRVTLQPQDMIGDSAPMRQLCDRIRKVAPSDCTVLIGGETGTGKEVAARAMHQSSPRARHPFVAVNCAALTESLLESELFGHERGAFTGAASQKKGRFEIADRGTLFLDEVGELAPALQAKLLRALQLREFERVGGTRTIKVDVRVVAATNQDLAAAVSAGRFRQDLWYRLNVVSLTMPPLRARRSDVPMLAAHFAAKYGRGRAIAVSPAALDALNAYDWPGNVRELENAIERAVVLGASNTIAVEDLPEGIVHASERAPVEDVEGAAYHESVRDTKRRLILDAIDRSGGNYTAAARLLGLNPTYLHRLLKNLQLRNV
jgi:transcriptional regulator with GAF, ATPase, and Fis domain